MSKIIQQARRASRSRLPGQVVEAALREEPIALLGLASSYVEAFDPARQPPGQPKHLIDFTLTNFVDRLLENPSSQTDALLLALAVMVTGDAMRRRIRLLVGARVDATPSGTWSAPEWLRRIDETRVDRVMEIVEPLRQEVGITGRAFTAGSASPSSSASTTRQGNDREGCVRVVRED